MVRLYELAKGASDIKYDLMNKTPKIIEHLIYISIDSQNVNRNHWVTEIHAFLHDISLLKSNHKLPKESFIYENTYGCLRDRVMDSRWMTGMLKDCKRKENIEITQPLDQIIKKVDVICNSYFKWIAKELSTVGYVSLDDIEDKINSLILRNIIL